MQVCLTLEFPFAFLCPNMYFSTVISCLEKLFSLCGMPKFVHSDNAPSFSSGSIQEFLLKRGVASNKPNPYHPTGNSQAQRYIGIVRKSIRLSLKSNNLPLSCWETVLPYALHSIQSLLNSTTNATPPNYSLTLIDILVTGDLCQHGCPPQALLCSANSFEITKKITS